jgi:hypothetical protein
MKNCQAKSTKAQSQKDSLWQPLNEAQSQSISGGGALLFANPYASMTPSLAGRLGIGG